MADRGGSHAGTQWMRGPLGRQSKLLVLALLIDCPFRNGQLVVGVVF